MLCSLARSVQMLPSTFKPNERTYISATSWIVIAPSSLAGVKSEERKRDVVPLEFVSQDITNNHIKCQTGCFLMRHIKQIIRANAWGKSIILLFLLLLHLEVESKVGLHLFTNVSTVLYNAQAALIGKRWGSQRGHVCRLSSRLFSAATVLVQTLKFLESLLCF